MAGYATLSWLLQTVGRFKSMSLQTFKISVCDELDDYVIVV